jgi:hypothetical protein
MAARAMRGKIVYIAGAGLSAGLNFPTIGNLLPEMWERLVDKGLATDLAKVIRFHHPAFNASLKNTFPDVETLLSEMQANEQLFDSSRPTTGAFLPEDLLNIRKSFLLELANWFHDKKDAALKKPVPWLEQLCADMKKEKAQVISFNWDLVLDDLLFGNALDRSSYGLDEQADMVRLIKPHGSLNWYKSEDGQHLKSSQTFPLAGKGDGKVVAFRPLRAPISTKRTYMPLIVPPVYSKQFEGDTFRRLWREAVSVLSTASEVRFLGYSLAHADFHARFILRCGFYNQVAGALNPDGSRKEPTGRARVTIVDPCEDKSVPRRIRETVGWNCTWRQKTVEQWMNKKHK